MQKVSVYPLHYSLFFTPLFSILQLFFHLKVCVIVCCDCCYFASIFCRLKNFEIDNCKLVEDDRLLKYIEFEITLLNIL